MNRRVVELTGFHVRIPLRRTIRHASFERAETENLIVRCVLDDGTEGYGEGVPREYVTGEDVESTLALVRSSRLNEQLTTCRDFDQVVAMAERLRLAPVPGDERGCRGNAGRCALELALLDAFGRCFGEPLQSVTRLLAPDLYEPRGYVRYSAAITSARAWKVPLAALVLRAYRFAAVKVKVGISGNDDQARLRKIRRLIGRKIDLRVDANEAWQPEEVVDRVRALEPARISVVEQPVPHDRVDSLSEIRRQLSLPIMLDESICSRYDAERAVALQNCDLFNLRVSKCGGFIPTLRLAQFAREHALGYQLGCQVGETALLSAAGRHFASSVGDIRYVEGSYDRHLMRETLSKEDLTFGWGGWAKALCGSGLGFTLDAEALERITVRKEPLFG
jgi:L-Ala-D/L-Glu epimerase / N-acetyl-D-glutamate racemase